MFIARSLAGLRFAVKDNIDATGFPTTAGTPGLAHCPGRDAPVVARLKAAGSHLVGKTNMHELSLGITSNNPHTGPVPNPADPRRIAGGSSGGSAAAVAAGEVDFALGTDTGGSVRIPAAFCGVYGFRPSTGRYPSRGILGLSRSRDTAGIHARDLALLEAVDAELSGEPAPQRGWEGRVGIPTWLWRDLDPHVERLARERVERIAGGSAVEIAADGLFEQAAGVAQTLVEYETLGEIERYLRGSGVAVSQVLAHVGSADAAAYFQKLAAQPVTEEAYAHAKEHQGRLRGEYERMFAAAGVDLIAFPTTAMVAPPVADEFITRHNGRDVPIFPLGTRNLVIASVVGSPSLSIPAPGEGLPVGLCFEALPGRDRWLLGRTFLR
ncbi:MAG TPA: amidase family protein [Beutenbergiaceae bacterium]|nr:amidase family protein [Beutenbergiaceae bacterium]